MISRPVRSDSSRSLASRIALSAASARSAYASVQRSPLVAASRSRGPIWYSRIRFVAITHTNGRPTDPRVPAPHEYNWPELLPTPTDDTAGSVFNNAVAAILQDGITRGCDTTGTRFCPNQPVTRGQMATFLARALDL